MKINLSWAQNLINKLVIFELLRLELMINFTYDRSKFRKFGKMEHFEDSFNDAASIPHVGNRFIVSEKIDGCNIGIYIDPDQVCAFSRNGENALVGLYNFKNDSNKLTDFIEHIQFTLKNHHNLENKVSAVYLYGEYYGSNIMRRIEYKGNGGQFKFFEMWNHITNGDDNYWMIVDQEYFIPSLFEDNKSGTYYSDDLIIRHNTYKNISINELKDHLPLPFKSEYADQNAEGYVISEFDSNHQLVGRWKWKDKAFCEKREVRHVNEFTSEAKKYHELFMSYFNENRVLNVLSKTTERNRIDMLVRMLVNDALEDFGKDYGFEMTKLDEKELKFVFNNKSVPYILIKKYIDKESR